MKIKAEVQAYSSVVGGGVLLIANDGKGPMAGQIMFICHGDYLRDKETQMRLSKIIADAINAAEAAR